MNPPATSHQPLATVIIVNYNAGAHLRRCLESLLAQTYSHFNIILVDNASTDHSLNDLPNDPRIALMPLSENVGFAKANNLAAQQAKGTWLALLNPDAFPTPTWLEKLLAATEEYPFFRLFGSTQINAEHPHLLDGAGDGYSVFGFPYRRYYQQPFVTLPPTGEVFSPCAAAALYNHQLFLQNGGFDESFFCYCEDVDLAFRLRLQGERCLQVAEAVVYHVGSAITGKGSDFSRYWGSRNRFRTYIKNMPGALLALTLPFHLLIQLLLLTIQPLPRLHGLLAAFSDVPTLLKQRRAIQKARTISTIELWKWLTWGRK